MTTLAGRVGEWLRHDDSDPGALAAELANCNASELREILVELRPSIDRVRVSVTGLHWLGGGFGSMLAAARDLIDSSTSEITASVYSLTAGGEFHLKAIQCALERGVSCDLIINRLETKSPEVRRELMGMVAESEGALRIYDFSGGNGELHAKCLVVDRSRALVGSANWTWNGAFQSHEMGVRLEGPSAAAVAMLLDRLRLNAAATLWRT